MHGQADEHQVGPGALEAIDRALTGVAVTVVDDPEHALRGCVGLGAHDQRNQTAEWRDPGLGLTAPEQAALGVMDIERGEVDHRPQPGVRKLAQSGAAGPGRDGLVAAEQRRQLAFLIGADHIADMEERLERRDKPAWR